MLAKEKAAKAGHDDHAHEEASPLWKYVSGGLFLLLLVSLAFRKTQSPAEPC